MENQENTKKPKASWKYLNKGPIPVARPSEHIQLTPIIQPIAFVPYSSQMQPLAMFSDEDED